jgi:hypothetical protein
VPHTFVSETKKVQAFGRLAITTYRVMINFLWLGAIRMAVQDSKSLYMNGCDARRIP